ncbi:hypothetical protein [Tomitella cavernea]|uniref:Uncharacterized protein n=1 Tax=Tomitella cavernea TaxID=1387982 RepID=A0ABP9CAU1_9ACTN|nr:hypothetical protein [Tomitella cavernea]
MADSGGRERGTAVVDIGPITVRAWADGGVTRQRAAVLRTREGLAYGDEAARRSGTDLGAYESALPSALDEEYTALGDALFRTVELFRGLLLHVLSAVSVDADVPGRAGGAARDGRRCVPARIVLVLPAQWGTIRRGVVERAAAALADDVLTVGSTWAAVAAAEAEGQIRPGGTVGVVEQWPDCTVSSVVDRPPQRGPVAGGRRIPGGDQDRPPEHRRAVHGAGVVLGRAGATELHDVAGLLRGLAGLNGGVAPDAVIAVPRAGWEFDRAVGAASGARILCTDGDAPLRGAVLLARGL